MQKIKIDVFLTKTIFQVIKLRSVEVVAFTQVLNLVSF